MTDRLIKIRFIGQGITTVAGQVTALGKSVGATADKMTSAEKDAQKFRRGLDPLGRTAGKVGLIAAAGLGAIVAATANFDQAMSNVQAATHETASNMEDLRKAAIKTGADTVFSASEAAGAIENLAKAGVSTKDILNGGLNGALALAAAGGLQVADAAEIAATAMTQFKLSGKDVPHIADLLAAGAGKAQGDVTDMSMALKQAGLVASQAGISIEETTGTLSAFASAGLLGSDAGTSFRTMLLRLTPQSQQAQKAIDKYNLSAFDAQGNFIGLAAYAQKLKDGLGGLTVQQRQATLATIFGTDAIRAANVLYDQGASGISEWTNKVNDSGYAAETASIRMDNLKGDLEQLKGSLETALIGAGEGSQGPLRGLVQNLTDAVNAFNKLPGPMQSTVTGMLAITAITGGGLWFGAKVIGGIANTRKALNDLGIDASRVGRTMRTALAAGAILEGLNLLQSELDRVFDRRLDDTNLGRSLDALSRGEVTGALKKYGDDLHGFGDEARLATGWLSGLTNAVGKIPVVGGILSDPSLLTETPKDAAENIEKLDDALAGLVESGQGDQAAQIFERLRDAASKAGVSTGDLNGLFEQYRTAIDNAKGSTDDLAGSQSAAQGSAQGLAAQQTELTEAIKEQQEAASDTAHEFVGLADSLNDSKVSLNDWIKDMAKQATALRDFTKNAQTAAKKGLREGLIAELEAAGPEGALRMKQLADGTKEQIREANKAWRDGQKAIRNYVAVVAGVPPSVATEIDVRGDKQAMAILDRIKARAEDVAGQYRVTFVVNQLNAINRPKGPGLSADGGTVPKTGLPYADRHPYMLADGEEVVSNRYGQADKWRPLLKAINAGLADGGTAGRMPAGALSPIISHASIDPTDRLLGYRDARGALVDALRTVLSEMPVVRAERDPSLLFGAS